MTVSQKKHEMKAKYIYTNKKLESGRRTVLFSVLTIFFLRLALFIFELAYFSSKGLDVSVISNVLLLPLFLILYMIYDGNKGIASIPALSAVVRIIVYFAVTFEDVSKVGGNLYTGIFIGIMVLQFLVSVLVSAATKCQAYFTVMQKINFQIQKEFLSGRGRK